MSISILCFSFYPKAQSNDSKSSYFFSGFISGSALLKSGEIQKSLFNYDTENQQIVFNQNNQVLQITNPRDIDTIFIDTLKFIYHDNKFFKVATQTKIPLLILYYNKPHPKSMQSDHTATSSQNSNVVSNSVVNTSTTKLYKDDYFLKFNPEYFIIKNDNLYRIKNFSVLLNYFPSKKDQLNQYIQENKLKQENENDMVALINFSNKISE